MTGVAIKARRTSTATPLEFSLTGNGPVTGATVVVAVRDGQSSVALPSYLDFDDDEFKTAGWTTRQAALTELGGGFYARALDINAITNLPAATVVLREAVAELRRHVDCLSVRSLPDEYLAAIKGVAPAWVHAPLAIASGDSPSQQLRRLDPLLEAINARLVG